MKGYIKVFGDVKFCFQFEYILFFNIEIKFDLYVNLKEFFIENKDEMMVFVCYNDEVGLEVVNVCRQFGMFILDKLLIIG